MSDGQTHGERLGHGSGSPVRRDTVRVRLGEHGPWVDLGCTPDELITGGLDSLNRLAREAADNKPLLLSPIVVTAIRRLMEARANKLAKGYQGGRRP